MAGWHWPRHLVAALGWLAIVATPAAVRAQPVGAGTGVAAGTTLSIDELYQPQSIIGTTPEGYAWAADGSRVLFLWNDEGFGFRDVWSASSRDGKRIRLTFVGRDRRGGPEDRGIAQAVVLGRDRIAYVLGGKLYLQNGSAAAVNVESDRPGIRQLAVSPDGRGLAFVAGGQLWVRAIAAAGDKMARRIAGDADPRVAITDFQWGADSRRIVFSQADERLVPQRDIVYQAKSGLQTERVTRAFPGDETTRTRIGVVDVGVDLGSGATRFYERPDAKDPVWGYGLSADGRRLFINSSDFQVKDHDVYVYDVASGARETFYHLNDPRHLRPDWQVAWAPGDDGLIILTDRDGYLQLYHQATAKAAPRQLTSGTWEIASFSVDAAHKQVYFLSNQAALPERQVYRVPAAGGAITRVSPATAGTHAPVFSPDFGHAASWFSNDTMPAELMLLDTAKPGSGTLVTRSPRPAFYRQAWADVRYVQFPSHVDGTNLVGRLSLPANYDPSKRYPLIIGSVYSDSVQAQWGGRIAHPTWGLDQYLVGHGYIILNVNVRGSWGQGHDHNVGLLHSYGGVDIDDLESGVRYLVARGYADPKRVGIWGSSYGGLMTLMSLAKKPGVYAAGIAGAPASNVWHAYPEQEWVMGPPDGADMPGRYEAQSALFQAQRIRDPLMIIHGTRDQVVLYADTVALTEKLIANEQPFELVTLPGANHGWDNDTLVQTRFAFRKMVDFLDRNVKDKP